MIGTLENLDVSHGAQGQQYTTIDSQVYVTWFDARDPNLHGLRAGAVVEFNPRPGPTVLCHSPWVQDHLPSAKLLRVVKQAAEAR